MAQKMICTNCGHQGRPKRKTRAGMMLEILLWIFFVVPGLVFTIWRQANRYRCPRCETPNMIPTNSLKAAMLMQLKDVGRKPTVNQAMI